MNYANETAVVQVAKAEAMSSKCLVCSSDWWCVWVWRTKCGDVFVLYGWCGGAVAEAQNAPRHCWYMLHILCFILCKVMQEKCGWQMLRGRSGRMWQCRIRLKYCIEYSVTAKRSPLANSMQADSVVILNSLICIMVSFFTDLQEEWEQTVQNLQSWVTFVEDSFLCDWWKC